MRGWASSLWHLRALKSARRLSAAGARKVGGSRPWRQRVGRRLLVCSVGHATLPSGSFSQHWALHGHTQCHWAFHGHTQCHWAFHGHIQCIGHYMGTHSAIGHTQCHWALHGHTQCHWALHGHTQCHWAHTVPLGTHSAIGHYMGTHSAIGHYMGTHSAIGHYMGTHSAKACSPSLLSRHCGQAMGSAHIVQPSSRAGVGVPRVHHLPLNLPCRPRAHAPGHADPRLVCNG